MATYYGMDHASSKDPHDWGRAMCAALNRLLDEAKGDRSYLEHKHLLGQDIVMRIEAEGDGARVHLSWKPQNQEDAPPDTGALPVAGLGSGGADSGARGADFGAGGGDNGESAEEAIEGAGRGG
ncbi:hypothetical protein [Sinomonas halotolerans]|uniref:Amphi-Trp domain-containing protein n=1 Tax=Sinomonas halotolerans TaxID=1644133 RepID=A0ABU9X1E3_9MICC